MSTQLTDLINAATLYAKDDGAWAEQPQDIAETAVQLADIAARAQKALDGLKPVLRAQAGAERNGESHVNWGCASGRVSVTFPDPRYTPKKGTDWKALQASLGDVFDIYFSQKVSYSVRKDIEALVKTRMGSAEIGTILECLQRDEPTPRVGFKPNTNAQ